LFRQGYYSAAHSMLERPALRRASWLVALSEATRNEFVQHYDLNPARVAVVPEAVDPQRFAPRNTSELRQRLALNDSRILVYVGFSNPRKGLEYLAAGLSALPPNVRLVIVGRWAAGYRARVQQAAGPGWQHVLEVGSVPDDDIPAYLSLADLVVLPSLLEGFGLPALEALACGTPVVATNAGSLPEVVGPCGMLVPPRNTDALVAAITKLLNNEPRRRQLAQCARQRALTQFSMQQSYTGMLTVYQQALAQPPHPPFHNGSGS
jgi:glycosyltransferase involved in cell wall biosynthesis